MSLMTNIASIVMLVIILATFIFLAKGKYEEVRDRKARQIKIEADYQDKLYQKKLKEEGLI